MYILKILYIYAFGWSQEDDTLQTTGNLKIITCVTELLLIQVPVYVRVVFLKIGEIDTLKEKYSADVYIQARWREPALDGKTHLVSKL